MQWLCITVTIPEFDLSTKFVKTSHSSGVSACIHGYTLILRSRPLLICT